MANINAPTGFTPLRRFDGAAWTSGITTAAIAAGNTTAIYKGDVVTQLNTGYITLDTPSSTVPSGIFVGCSYFNSVTGYTQFSNYWPGSGATGDVTAYVITDPNVVYSVQATTGPIAFADIGANTNYVTGTGNALTGLSGATLSNVGTATTTTLPFRIIGLTSTPGNGSDATTAYNRVEVVWNTQFYKVLAGI